MTCGHDDSTINIVLGLLLLLLQWRPQLFTEFAAYGEENKANLSLPLDL